MKSMLLAGVALALATIPASAALQISISANGQTFTCADGQACDLSTVNNNLLAINTVVGGVSVEIALAQAVFGSPNTLELSSSSIINNQTLLPATVTLVASDTDYVGPVRAILESGSLTFNNAVGSGPSSLSFFADPANVQGANPLNTPGVLLDTVTGTPTTNPDSFAGTLLSPFSASGPFSMTESATLRLVAGGSITGFNQSEQSSVIPEPRTWMMMLLGFGLLGLIGARKQRRQRLAV
jgi:hypothetical protein